MERLTKEDVKKIEAEIEERKLVVRPKALEDLKEARSHGDLSENFEYYAAKKFKNQNESRIRYLDRMLRTAEIVEDEAKEDEVGINNTVTLLILEDEVEETYKLVTSVRANSLEGLISIESPLGSAMRGRKVGDVITVHVNDGYSYEAKILKIDKTTDDANDRIRSY